MAKYLSGRQRTLKVGIESYTNSQLSLEVFGSTNISDNLNVTGSAEFNNGISVSGITTFANNINIVGVTTLTTLDVTDVVTGVTTFDNINTLGVVTSSLFVGNLTGTATSAGFATTSTYSLYSLYSSNSGVATYSSVAGVATFATNAGIASTALFAYGLVGEYVNNAGVATYASIAGIATYASSAGVATYSSVAGIATYATSAGLATYATSAGVATYATSSGIATYSSVAGFATYATSAGVATYSGFSGIATYANVSGVATYATTAGFATNAGIASTALFAFSVIGGFVANSGVATYASIAGVATYANVAGLATYSTNAGVATYATSSGVSTNSNNVQIINDVSTNSVHYLNFTNDITGYNPVKVSGTNLTFNPSTSNLGIGTDNPRSKLNVIGNVNVVGLVTATRFVGSAASLTALTDAVAGVYGNGANAPQITVDATGRITSITQVAITTTGAGAGSLQGIYVYDDYDFLGFSSNISFRQGLLPVSIGNTIYVDALDSIQYWVKNYAGIHTSSNVGIGTTLPSSTLTVFGDGFFTNDVVATTFVGKFTGNLTGIASTAITAYNVFGGFVANAGVATYASIAGVATYSSVAGLTTYATNAGIATYSSVAGIATYATSAGLATYATSAGIATYATSSGIATYATSAGVATYSSNSGIATFATNAGIASTALVALSVVGGFVANAGIATYATSAGVATYATTAGFATNAGIASTAIFALNVVGGYVSNAGVATYANVAGVATYATTAGVATYSDVTGIATYATTAGIATYATTAGIATLSQGLTGTPNIVVGFATVNNTLNVGAGGTVISTTLAGSVGVGSTNPVSKFAVNGNATVHGSVTATSYIGSASSLTSLTGAVAGVYGNGANAPQITVDSTGRITSITQVAITTTGAGSALLNGVNVYDDNGFIGFSSNINAGNNIGAVSIGNTITLNSIVHWDVTSTGINTLSNVGIGTTNPKTALTVSGVTSTSQLYVTGLSTFIQPINVTGNQYSIFGNGLVVQGTAVSDLDGNNFAVQLQNGLQVTDGSFIRAHITSSGNILGVGLTIFGTTFTNQLSVSGVSTFNERINASAGGILFDTSSYTGSDEPIKLWVGNSGGARYFTLRRSNGGQVTFDNAHPTGHNDHRAPTHSFTQTGSEYYALFNNGAVKLYHPGSDGGILSQKFETIGAGVTVTGTTFTNQLSVSGVSTFNSISIGKLTNILNLNSGDNSFNNNNIINVGGDMAIFHLNDGTFGTSNRIIVNENDLIIGTKGEVTGNIFYSDLIRVSVGNDLGFPNTSNVSLGYGDATIKLQTIGTGVTVTGTTFTNQLSVSGVSTCNQIKVGFTTLTANANNNYRNSLSFGDKLYLYSVSESGDVYSKIESQNSNIYLGIRTEGGGSTYYKTLVGIITADSSAPLLYNQERVALGYGNDPYKLETIGIGVTVTGTTFTNQLSVSGITTSQVISVNNLVERGAISFTGIGTTVRTLHTGLSTSTYNSVEYTVSAKYRLLPGYLHLTKILVTHDGATTYITEYGTVHSNGPLSTYNVDINAGSIRLLATPVTSDQTDYTISFTAFK